MFYKTNEFIYLNIYKLHNQFGYTTTPLFRILSHNKSTNSQYFRIRNLLSYYYLISLLFTFSKSQKVQIVKILGYDKKS